MRAMRADKLTYAALEATLALWAQPSSRDEIPVYRMLTLSAPDIERRALDVMHTLRDVPGLTCRIADGHSTTGGGSAPDSTLPTRVIRAASRTVTASALDAHLRRASPPVIARIQGDEVVLNLRTVDPNDDALVARAIAESAIGPKAISP